MNWVTKTIVTTAVLSGWDNASALRGSSNIGILQEDYESKSAAEKQAILMDLVRDASGTSSRFPNSFELMQFLLFDDLTPTFAHNSDTVPYSHRKRIHSVGGICSAKFEAVNGNPFSGLFQGDPYMLLRLSLAQPASDEAFIPGIGVKFLRDGIPSANFVAMFSLEGQVGSGNFFAHEFSNHVKELDESASLGKTLLGQKFARTSNPPVMVGLSHIAAKTVFGDDVPSDSFVFPFKLILVPNPFLQTKFKDAKPLDSLEDQLSQIPVGTKLYDLFALESPNSVERVEVGSFTTTSEILFSENGDNLLFFRHQKIEEDAALRPDWF